MKISKIKTATLKIADMRFAYIDGAPKRSTLLILYTNVVLSTKLVPPWQITNH